MLDDRDTAIIREVAFTAAEKVAESTKAHFETLLRLQDEKLASTKLERHLEIQTALQTHSSTCEAKRETCTAAKDAAKDASDAKKAVEEIKNRARGAWWSMALIGTVVATVAAILVELFRK